MFLIQGDNSANQQDGWIESQNILGCITRVERNNRRIYLGFGPERYLLTNSSSKSVIFRILSELRFL